MVGCDRFFKNFKELKAHTLKCHPAHALGDSLKMKILVPSAPERVTGRHMHLGEEFPLPSNARPAVETPIFDFTAIPATYRGIQVPVARKLAAMIVPTKSQDDAVETHVMYKLPQIGDYEYGSDYLTAATIAAGKVISYIAGCGKLRRRALLDKDQEAAMTGVPHGYAPAVVASTIIHQIVANVVVDPRPYWRDFTPEQFLANLTSFLDCLNGRNPPYRILDSATFPPIVGIYLAPAYQTFAKLSSKHARFLAEAKIKIQNEKNMLHGPRPIRRTKAISQVDTQVQKPSITAQAPRRSSVVASKQDNVGIKLEPPSDTATRRMSAPSLGQTSGVVRSIRLLQGGKSSIIPVLNVERVRPDSAPAVTNYRTHRLGKRNKAGMEISTINTMAASTSTQSAPIGAMMMRRDGSAHSSTSLASSLDLMLLTPEIADSPTFGDAPTIDEIELETLIEEAEIEVKDEGVRTTRKRTATVAAQFTSNAARIEVETPFVKEELAQAGRKRAAPAGPQSRNKKKRRS